MRCCAPRFAAAIRTLSEGFTLRESAIEVLLKSSPDLTCINLMCEKVGQGCACRLALSLQRMPQVEVIDVSGNRLPLLPDSLWTRPKLKRVVAADNALVDLSLQRLADSIADANTVTIDAATGSACPSATGEGTSRTASSDEQQRQGPLLPNLEEIDLRNNRLALPALRPLSLLAGRGHLPLLAVVRLQGNPAADQLRSMATSKPAAIQMARDGWKWDW